MDFSSLDNPNLAYDALNIAGYAVSGVTAAVLTPLMIIGWPILIAGFIINEKKQQEK